MEETESILKPGYTLDRYELLCPLASGGMASVWLARMRGKRGFEKLFAIKTIRAELGDDANFEEMFLDEARIASGIQHPNVAHILDLGEKDGILYLVMEWVDGDSLAKVRKFAAKAGTKVPLGLALRIVGDACAGLHAAHELKDEEGRELGVVHRDVSPQNLLVAVSGGVKVIDFGIAKAENRAAPKTRTGIVKGKLQYMAPEQARAGKMPIDRRVDLWSLGVCLYELVAEKLPFDGDNQFEILTQVTGNDPPPPIPDVPESVREILAHSLARNPADRFATAAAMRRAIETAISELDLPSTSDDVASFVEKYLPERAAKRKELVAKALREAAQRGSDPIDAFSGTVAVALDPRGKPIPARPVKPKGIAPLSAREILDRPSLDHTSGTLHSSALAASAGIPTGGGGKWAAGIFTVVAAASAAYFFLVRPQSHASAAPAQPPPNLAAPQSSERSPNTAPAPTLVVIPSAALSGSASADLASTSPSASASTSPSASATPSATATLSLDAGLPSPIASHPTAPPGLHPGSQVGQFGRRPVTGPTTPFSALAEPEIPTIAPSTPSSPTAQESAETAYPGHQPGADR